jgi:hypothetical protein
MAIAIDAETHADLQRQLAQCEADCEAQSQREVAAWAERDVYLASNVKLVAEIERLRAAPEKALSMLLDAAMWADTYDHKKSWASEARKAVAQARGDIQQSPSTETK